LYTASVILTVWGIAHIVPVKKVFAGFGDITADNLRIFMLEWINGGMVLIFTGILTGLVALSGDPGSETGLFIIL
jgi:hypothetical protein